MGQKDSTYHKYEYPWAMASRDRRRYMIYEYEDVIHQPSRMPFSAFTICVPTRSGFYVDGLIAKRLSPTLMHLLNSHTLPVCAHFSNLNEIFRLLFVVHLLYISTHISFDSCVLWYCYE